MWHCMFPVGVCAGKPAVLLLASRARLADASFVNLLNEFGCKAAGMLIEFLSLLEGVSIAGNMLGQLDRRSALVCHCFRIYDSLQDPFLTT